MNNNNSKNNNIFDTSFVKPEDVFVSDDRTQISIIETNSMHDYCLYDTETTKQATPWVNGKEGHVTFSDLNPDKRYSIRVRQANKESKKEIYYIHSLPLVDDDKNKKDS